MNYVSRYQTPEGMDDLVMSSNGLALTGLWFEGSVSEQYHSRGEARRDLPVFEDTKKWLDAYFAGNPQVDFPLMAMEGLTPFRREVYAILRTIPFGRSMSYGQIAGIIASKHGLAKMSAQAVGGAVGRNPICILIPCHRVLGADGSLTGYSGGLENKRQLLLHEKLLPV